METRKLTELKPNPLNPRGEITHDVSIRELAMSIKAQGLLQPILITPQAVIIAGHRRVVAAKLAGLSEVPVIVKALTESEQLQVMLVENIQRNDLTPLQTARAYQELTKRGLQSHHISTAIGVTVRSVNEHLMVFKLPTELLKFIDSGALRLRHLPLLMELSVEDQARLGKQTAENKWGVLRLKNAIWTLNNPQPRAETISTTLDRIWERVEDGCYTPEAIARCGECGGGVFPGLTLEDIERCLETLVKQGKAEWRKQGGKGEKQRGEMTVLCVPADLPSGDGFDVPRESTAWNEQSRRDKKRALNDEISLETQQVG